jgi:hypothetical protein
MDLSKDQERLLGFLRCAPYGASLAQLASLTYWTENRASQVLVALQAKRLARYQGGLAYPRDRIEEVRDCTGEKVISRTVIREEGATNGGRV